MNSVHGPFVDQKRQFSLRQLLGAVLLLAALLGLGRWFYLAFVYATPLTTADTLSAHIGERVQFRSTIEWGAMKADPLIVRLGRTPIVFSFVGGELPSSQRTVTVTGVLEAYDAEWTAPGSPTTKLKYRLERAVWR